ncbi:three-Cys-motif partner protein TcmP [Candidatus Sumerlaeota bacterium]
MADTQPTLWDPDPHTWAKHQILRSYLQAWAPILSRRLRREPLGRNCLLFVDGFAGPGIYRKDEDGSPVLAIKTILDHSVELPVPVRFLFIEEKSERYASLKCRIADLKGQTDASSRIDKITLQQGECSRVLTEGIDRYDRQKRPLGPAFFFLDQFGYSHVPMNLIGRIMSHPQCEVLVYLNWEKMNRFMGDSRKWDALNRAFGGEEWKPALNMQGEERKEHILQIYKQCLRSTGKARYVWHFAMLGETNSLLNWLFFGTNSLRGLEVMKRAMTKTDTTGCFQFSDGDNPLQLQFLDVFTNEWLADHLSSHFRDEKMPVSQIKEFVLEHTPMYLFKGALARLEKEGRLEIVGAPANRRIGTFSDLTMPVLFQKSP